MISNGEHHGQNAHGSSNEIKNKVRNFVRNFRPIFVQKSHSIVDQIDRNSDTKSSGKAPSSRHHDYYDYSQWIPVIKRKIT